MTEFPGDRHVVLVGDGVAELDEQQLVAAAGGERLNEAQQVRVVKATTTTLSRAAEDSASNVPPEVRPAPEDGIVARDVWRHEARVQGLVPGDNPPYRVVSLSVRSFAGSGTFRLGPAALPWEGQRILLTSDHQAMINTPANLQLVAETIGEIDAVFLAGDLVNIPDRASKWFDDTRGSAFFPVLQGNGARAGSNGITYQGAEIIQNAPIFPAIGNPRGAGPARRGYVVERVLQRGGPPARGGGGVRRHRR
ncbi:hypothetical protein BH20ACT5_BH20ACT5_04750 [soil metagenome]